MTFAEFEVQFNELSKTPTGTLKCFLIACLEYGREKNKDASKMMGLCLPKDKLDNQGEPSRANTMWSQMFKPAGPKSRTVAPIPASYLGGTPANHYAADYNHVITSTDHKYFEQDENNAKIFIQSGGKDFQTPVTLKRNNSGSWKIMEFSSIYTGVKYDHDEGDF
jgi:hypothetical protein